MTATEYEMPPDVVPPGDQTGVYYIPISNLPFNVSWQQVKDYVRQFCAVDHVEIFQKSTCGWVRVLEKENFEVAYENLNGKEFQGRSIIADKRNATQPLVVRDLNAPAPAKHMPSKSPRAAAPMTSESLPFAAGGPVCRSDSSLFPSSASTPSSSFSQVSSGLRYAPVLVHNPTMSSMGGDAFAISSPTSSFLKSSDVSFTHGPMQGYDALQTSFSQNNPIPFYGYGTCPNLVPAPHPFLNYSPSSCDPQSMCGPSTSFAVQQPCYNEFYPFSTAAMSNQMANMTLGESPPDGIVYTEQRGIHIREITQCASEEDVRRMILKAVGPEAGLINFIEIPLKKNRNSRGWASVHFHSADLARRMVDRLNGAEFKSKILQVRLMKEGEAINGGFTAGTTTVPSNSRQHRSSRHHHRREDIKRTERKERDREEKASSNGSISEASVPSTPRKSAPLVVGGSLTAKPANSSSPSSSKGKEKQGRKTSAVIIADGSSGRKSEKPSKR